MAWKLKIVGDIILNSKHKQFRIWDKAGEGFLGIFEWNRLPQMLFPEKWIVQQCIAKYDSKGELIFEGDILYYTWKIEHGEQYEGRGEVFYDEESAAFLFDRISQFSWLDSNINWDTLKIIGNSCENPELI